MTSMPAVRYRVGHYAEHGSYLPDRRANVGLLENLYSITGKVRPSQPIHRFQALLLWHCITEFRPDASMSQACPKPAEPGESSG
jgi:hypothetical protein